MTSPSIRSIAIVLACALAQAPARAADAGDWQRWITARQYEQYHDYPRELAFLHSTLDDARARGDVHQVRLALGRQLYLAADDDTDEVATLEKQADEMIPTARTANDPAGLFSLLIGSALAKLSRQHIAEATQLVDEAGALAARVRSPGMLGTFDFMQARVAETQDDSPHAFAFAGKVLESDADRITKLEARLSQIGGELKRPSGKDSDLQVAAEVDVILAGIDREDLPGLYDIFALAKNYAVRNARPAEALAQLRALISFDEKHAIAQQTLWLRRIWLATLLAGAGHWEECRSVLDQTDPPRQSASHQTSYDHLLIKTYTHLHDPRIRDAIAAGEALLGQTRNPNYREMLSADLADAYAGQGDYRKAFDYSRAAGVATNELIAATDETTRQQMQTLYDVHRKDQENERLRTQQAQLERNRTILAAGLSLAALTLVVLGGFLTLQVRQRRRLAALSAKLESANHQLRDVNDELSTLNASRTRLLASACHDLRQPAHALGLLSELAADQLPDDTPAPIDGIRRCSASLSDMLDMLLDMTQLEGDRYRPTTSSFPIDDMLRELGQQFMPFARRKGLALQVAGCEALVHTDRHLLRRMLLNLLSNAIRYTESGTVSLGATTRDGEVTITVRDTGRGIPAEKQREIFAEYIRLDAEDDHEGLGIGLPIVKRSADLLRLPMMLESTPGRGTCFTIRVPVDATPVVSREPERNASAQGQLVAVIEDDDDVRTATVRLLASRGFSVVDAASVEEALPRLAQHGHAAPDLLVSDLHLKGADGMSMIESLRQREGWEATRFVLLTGDLDAAVATRGAELGITVAYKPMLPRRLVELLFRLLETSRPTGRPSQPLAA